MIGIAIISFNRPKYLEKVLKSLASQIENDMAGTKVFMFQDGVTNWFT